MQKFSIVKSGMRDDGLFAWSWSLAGNHFAHNGFQAGGMLLDAEAAAKQWSGFAEAIRAAEAAHTRTRAGFLYKGPPWLPWLPSRARADQKILNVLVYSFIFSNL